MPTGSDGWRGERGDPSVELPIELATTGEFFIPPTFSEEPIGRIGRYEVLGRLAIGGMAEIYLARDDATAGASRYLVVKVVRPQLADQSAFGAMFLNEGRVALRLKHPNICHVYEFGIDGGRYFIAMEYVHGATLRNLLRREGKRGRTLPVPVALRIVAHVAEALSSAHKTRDEKGRGVVHRDVSPQNIMVGFDGVVKLLDFGVAEAQGDRRDAENRTFKGKVGYLAPEQCKGAPVDGRSDIFSLGVCLWEALTGRALFRRKSDVETMMAIVHDPVPNPASFGAEVPLPVLAVLMKSLHKDPDERYQSAGEMNRALQQYLVDTRQLVDTTRIAQAIAEVFGDEVRRGPVLDRSDDVVARLGVPSELTIPVEDRAGHVEAPRRRGGVLGPLLGLSTAAAFAAVTWVLAGPVRSVDPSPPVPALGGPSGAGLAGDPTDPPTGEAPVASGEEEAIADGAPGADAGAQGDEGEDRRRKKRLRTKRGFLVEPDF